MKTTQFRWLAATLLFVAAMAMPSTAWAQEVTYTNGFGSDGSYQPATLTTDKYDINGDGTKDEVYEIENAGQLYWFAALVNGTDGLTQNKGANAVLTADITVNTGVLNADGTLASDVSGFKAWTPIGKSSIYTYSGTFDGQNHTVSGLYFNNNLQDYVGFFGYVVGSNSKISNVGVADSYFNGKEDVGGVCGFGNHNTISNCYNTGAVSGNSSVGGVCGYKYYGTISNCYNTGAVSGTESSVGGVCGYSNSGTITNCYFDSTVYGGNAVGTNTGTVSSNVPGKTSEQFKSGEVCYLLNNCKTDGTQAWYQDLTPETGDKSPVLKSNGNNTVYAGKPCMRQFSNTESELASVEHSLDEHGFCTVCGGYQPATDSNSDGVYEISNAGQLYWFAALVNGTLLDGTAQNLSANAVLTADITVNTGVLDANGTLASDVSGFKVWTPIGDYYNKYTGTFDGQSHTVSGLYFNDSQTDYVGLFGNNKSTIKNVGVADSYFNGKNYVGGVCGYKEYGTISNCYNTGAVSGSFNNIGGVCGYNNGTVANCYNTGAVSGSNSSVGGVCGNNYGGVKNCYNTGAVIGARYYIGGVCGRLYGNIENCYSIGTVGGSSDESVGALCGYNDHRTISNCYFDSSKCNKNAVGKNDGTATNTEGKTAEQFASGEVCYLLNNCKTDGTQAWYQDLTPETGDKSPVLKSNGNNTVYAGKPCMSQFSNTELASVDHTFDDHGFCTKCGGYKPADKNSDGVYEISNAGQLYWFAALVNGTLTDGTAQKSSAKAILVNDITVNTGVLNADGTLASDVSGFKVWTPIGNDYNKYIGIFDGQHHTVSGLYFNDSETKYVGLFGEVGQNGKVSNVGVVDSYFMGSDYIGGVCGYNYYATISNSYNTGAVSGGSKSVGGVCGSIFFGTISNCYNTGAVSGTESSVGGVCGHNSSGAISNCYNIGVVSGGSSSNSVGGVCGNCSGGNISHCYLDSTKCDKNAVGINDGVLLKIEGKSSEDFASGKVCYLLNKGMTDGTQAWYQDLTPETGDKHPVLKSNGNDTVYASQPCNIKFSNTELEPIEHNFDEHGFCTVCGAYQPATDSDSDGVYEIGNVGQLYWFAALVNGTLTDGTAQNLSANAVLTANITVNTGVLNADGTLASNVSGFKVWTPIGNYYHKYIGKFDGQHHTVSGLYFNDSRTKYIGIFGYVGENGKVSNVGVVDSYFNGNNYIGGVCGYNYGAAENCYSVSTISGTNYVGGVCGVNYGAISNCYSIGAVSGDTYSNVGGVCGYNSSGAISNCYSIGAVSGGNNSKVGGVCGYTKNGTIANCYFDNIVYNGNAVGNNEGATVSENVLGKTSKQFASGEVAYLLSQGSTVTDGENTTYYSGSVWGQQLGTDDYPVLGGLPVYYRDEVYTNTYGILIVGTNTITTSNEPPIWYEFTPEADGNYRFSSKTILGSICVNTEMTINNMQSMSYSPSYELSAKTTYYVYLYCAPGEYDLTIEKLNSTLKTGDNEIIVSTTGKLWYEFTPTETGSYQFSSTDLEGGSMYVVKDKNTTDDSRYITDDPVYELTADNIYYVAVSYAPGTYSLTIKKLDTTLEVGTNEFEVSAPRVWYEFTPTETGSYQFSSTQLTAGNLYVNTTKTESDYTDITTSPTYDLEAATTYYVAVNYAPGSYDLTITRLNNTPTAIETVTAPQIYAVDGRIVCDGEFRIYDLLGRDVTRLNGSLCGVYVVKTANAAVKVVVR